MRADWTRGRFEVVCPHHDRCLMALNTDMAGSVLWDPGDSEEVAVGPGYAGPEDSYPLLKSGDLLDHVRYVVECLACREEGKPGPYRLVITSSTIDRVVMPILLSCHASGTTWRESDMHGLLARAARAQTAE